VSSDEWTSLIDEFESIRSDMLRLAADSEDLLRDVHAEQRASARNLLHYLALRGRDLRPLQARLAASGLSSLGRAESHVLAALDSVLSVLYRLAGRPAIENHPHDDRIDLATGQQLLDAHTEAAIGPRPAGRGVAIMVTMPSEAAEDYTLVSQLVQQGMDCMRINCAHDDPERWARMIDNLGRAVERHGRPCRILMDLAGPKIRTGPLEPGPTVVKVRPQRDAFGRVNEPARLWLFPQEQPRPSPTPADASLPVPVDWLRQLVRNDRLHFVDTRGASRELRVVAVDAEGCWAESSKTCYIEPRTMLRIERRVEGATGVSEPEATVGFLPPAEMRLELTTGDELVITRPSLAGRNAVRNDRGRVLTPAMIGCTAEQIFEDARSGDHVWFDDGRIGGVVERREPDRLHVRITRTPARGAKLGSEKGINFPRHRAPPCRDHRQGPCRPDVCLRLRRPGRIVVCQYG
jgi:pyruvate kinase